MNFSHLYRNVCLFDVHQQMFLLLKLTGASKIYFWGFFFFPVNIFDDISWNKNYKLSQSLFYIPIKYYSTFVMNCTAIVATGLTSNPSKNHQAEDSLRNFWAKRQTFGNSCWATLTCTGRLIQHTTVYGLASSIHHCGVEGSIGIHRWD